MRQLTFSTDDDRSFFFSNLPMRQLTTTRKNILHKEFSKLPMRQLTGVIYAIILTRLDLHQFPPHRTQNLTLLSKLMTI